MLNFQVENKKNLCYAMKGSKIFIKVFHQLVIILFYSNLLKTLKNMFLLDI